MNTKTIALGLLGVIAIIVLYVLFATQKPIPPVQNETTVTLPSVVERGAQLGDLLTIDYVLTLENGTVVDTNNESLAQTAGLTTYIKGPYTFILGQSGKIQTFDNAILGAIEGATISKVIEPTEPVIQVVVNKTKVIPRMVTLPRYQRFKNKNFQTLFQKPPIRGDVVFSENFPWKYRVLNVTNETVLTELFVKVEETYQLPNTPWNSSVVNVGDPLILFIQNPKENLSIETEFGPATVRSERTKIMITFDPELGKTLNKSVKIGNLALPQQFKIINLTDTTFTLERIGALSDKRLKLTATVLSITESVKEVDGPAPGEVVSS